MENPLFDCIKNIIVHKVSSLNLALIFSVKQDFFGVKFSKDDKFFVCFISNYLGTLTFSYRNNCFEKIVNRHEINKDNMSEIEMLVSEVIVKNMAIYKKSKGVITEGLPLFISQDGIINKKDTIINDSIQWYSSEKLEEKKNKLQEIIDEFECITINSLDISDTIKNAKLSQIPDITISTRLNNCLDKNNVVTVGQFLNLDVDDFLKMRYLGENTFREVVQIRTDIVDKTVIDAININGFTDAENQKNKQDNRLLNIALKDLLSLIDVEHYKFNYTEEDYIKYIAFNSDIEDIFETSLIKIDKGEYGHRNTIIYKKRYGLMGEEDCTLQQVGDEYGISRERIRQITNKIHKKLKKFRSDFIIRINELPEADFMNYIVDGIGSTHGMLYIRALFDILGENELYNALSKCIGLIQNKSRRINNANSLENILLSHINFPNNISEITKECFKLYKVERNVEEHDHSINGVYALKNGFSFVEYESLLERKIISIFDNSYYVNDIKTQSLIVPYKMDGILHRYYPDLLVHLTDNRLVVVEVKSLYEMATTKNLTKYYALKDYCERNGYGYIMVDGRNNTIESLLEISTSIELEESFLNYLRKCGIVDLKMVQAFFKNQGISMDLRVLMKLLIKYRDYIIYSVRPFCVRYAMSKFL